MKKIFSSYILLLSIFLFYQHGYAQQIASIANININSKSLNKEREILIYTPQSYNENLLENYDVIYVFDAQNRELFDFVHSIINFIPNASNKYIVVGITPPYNEIKDYSRNNDLLPNPINEAPETFYGGYFGNAENFRAYITSEVIPYVEKNYRTKNSNRALS